MNESYLFLARLRGLHPVAWHALALTPLFAGMSVCTLVLGCGERADPASDRFANATTSGTVTAGTTRSGVQARAPTGAPRDACALIPVERVAAIVGGQVVTVSDPGPRESSCAYTDESGQLSYLALTVYWDGGRERLDIVQMGTGIAARLMAEPGDEAIIDSIVRPGAVEGIGDVALFSDILPSYVLTGDVLLELYMTLLPNARQHFRPLARTALARL